MKIPNPVIAVLADELSKHHTHVELNRLFMESGAPGEGNKPVKCTEWLKRINESKFT